MTVGTQELDIHQDIAVRKVDSRTFVTAVNKCLPNFIDIPMSHWREVDDTVPILNYGASPCTIVYIWNKTAGKIISGHFPYILKSETDDLVRQELKRLQRHFPNLPKSGDQLVQLPKSADIPWLSSVSPDEGYENSLAMLARIKTWIDASNQDIQVFLFGQNHPAYSKDPNQHAQQIVDSSLLQQELITIFNKLGIPSANIQDHRVPGSDKVDDTFFSPVDRVIFHHRGDSVVNLPQSVIDSIRQKK